MVRCLDPVTRARHQGLGRKQRDKVSARLGGEPHSAGVATGEQLAGIAYPLRAEVRAEVARDQG